MISAFGVGVYYAIEACEYNAATRDYPKTSDPIPHLMPKYWSFEVGATCLLLFIFPMFLFIFYHKLEKYLQIIK